MKFEDIYQWCCENPGVVAASRREEHRFWYDLALSVPVGCILECGSYKCEGTNTLAAACQERIIDMFSIDGCLADVPKEEYENKSLVHPDLRVFVCLINTDAMSAIDVLQKKAMKFSLVVLDDDHGYPHVMNEFLAVRGMIIPGGVVCFHDCDFDGVKQSIQHLERLGLFEGFSEIETPYRVGDELPPVDVGFMYPKTENHWSVRAWRREPHGIDKI